MNGGQWKNNILNDTSQFSEHILEIYMSYFAYVCKTEGKNGISHLISIMA